LHLLATGVVSHREELIKIREGTALSVRSFVNRPWSYDLWLGRAAIQTNKQTNKQLWIYSKVLPASVITFWDPILRGDGGPQFLDPELGHISAISLMFVCLFVGDGVV
jgi:hypothetical protein